MNTKLFLLCSMVLFSGSTKAAQEESELVRMVTIFNNLPKAVRIYSDPAPKLEWKSEFFVINSTDKDVLLSNKKEKYLINGNKFYYSPLKFESFDYDSIEQARNAGHDPWIEDCRVLIEQEKEITLSPDKNEITLEEQA